MNSEKLAEAIEEFVNRLETTCGGLYFENREHAIKTLADKIDAAKGVDK